MKKLLRTHWDITTAYSVFLVSIAITYLLLQGCNDWGCLGLIMIALIGYIIGLLFIATAIYRQLTTKLNNARWYFIILYGVPGVYVLFKFFI